MRPRILIALFLAVLTSISATPMQLAGNQVFAQTTTTIPMLPGTSQQIAVGPGSQTNPHVACNFVSYTNDDFEGSSTIRYRDWSTNTEHVVPGNNLDRLSDTDGRRIAFTQIEEETGNGVHVYDTLSQVSTRVPGNQNIAPTVGGNLVAFMDGDLANLSTFEIQVHDVNTGAVTQLTNDTLLDGVPAVSPDGKVVVWQKCQADETNCDIYSATQTGPGAFTTRLLTGEGEDSHPDTNGQLVVYLSNKSGDNDIYLRRVDGSNEMHLSLPGAQRNPHISGDLIVFESPTANLAYDVFLYDLRTAQLYQVTNTPGASEGLSDIVAGCDGVDRIVYAISDVDSWDVYAFTFHLSDSVADQLNDLIALVKSFNLHDGTEASLIIKLQDALAAVNASNDAAACIALTSFINASRAQSGKKLTAAQVQQLVQSATQVKSDLGCQ